MTAIWGFMIATVICLYALMVRVEKLEQFKREVEAGRFTRKDSNA